MEKAPYDTGNLRRDIGTRTYSDYARVGTTKSTPYAKIQEYGGTIYPKRKKLLAWKK